MSYINVCCEECKLFFNAPSGEVKRGNGKYCSRNCSAAAISKKHKKRYEQLNVPNVECAYCNKMFYKNETKKKISRSGLYFCCREHKDLAQRIGSGIDDIKPSHYTDSPTNYREYYLRNASISSCMRCGYDKYPSILQIHYIDRNRKNTTMENLIVLCPNCHEEDHLINKDGRYSIKSAPSI